MSGWRVVAGEGRCRGRHGERPLVMVLPSCDGPVARDFDSKCSRVCSGASRRGISLAWMRLAGFQRDSFEGWWNEGAWSTPQPPSHLEFSHILAPLNFPLDVTAKRGSMGSGGKAAPAERERERAIYSRANGVTKLASRARCRLPAGRPTHCLAAVLAAACLVPLHAAMPRRNPPTEPRPGRASSRAGGGSVVGPRGVQLRLRGGRGASDEEEAGAGVGAHQPAAFRGEVKLCGQHSLAHIVENAHGPLRVLCGGGGHSWPDAAAVSSPFRVDIAAEQPNAILAGQWFLMKSSRGCFSGVTLVHRSVMDKRNLELREDMLIIEGRGTAGEVWDFQNCSMWTEWGGVLTCMGSAQVTMADCVLSGAGAGNMRAEHGVAAYDDARVGLRRCLLQVCVCVYVCVCVRACGYVHVHVPFVCSCAIHARPSPHVLVSSSLFAGRSMSPPMWHTAVDAGLCDVSVYTPTYPSTHAAPRASAARFQGRCALL